MNLARMKLSCKPFSSLINKKEEHKSINKATFSDSSWFLTSIKAETLLFSCLVLCSPAVQISYHNNQNQVNKKTTFFKWPRQGPIEALLLKWTLQQPLFLCPTFSCIISFNPHNVMMFIFPIKEPEAQQSSYDHFLSQRSPKCDALTSGISWHDGKKKKLEHQFILI